MSTARTRKTKPSVAARVRAEMTLRGTHLKAWAEIKGLPRQTVYAAVNGEKKGKKSQEVLDLLKGEGYL
jgi:gp16 family phage-associated protein